MSYEKYELGHTYIYLLFTTYLFIYLFKIYLQKYLIRLIDISLYNQNDVEILQLLSLL